MRATTKYISNLMMLSPFISCTKWHFQKKLKGRQCRFLLSYFMKNHDNQGF